MLLLRSLFRKRAEAEVEDCCRETGKLLPLVALPIFGQRHPAKYSTAKYNTLAFDDSAYLCAFIIVAMSSTDLTWVYIDKLPGGSGL